MYVAKDFKGELRRDPVSAACNHSSCPRIEFSTLDFPESLTLVPRVLVYFVEIACSSCAATEGSDPSRRAWPLYSIFSAPTGI